MKCVICKSPDVKEKKVDEEIRVKNDVVFIPITVISCQNCGEKYYDRRNMKLLEDVEASIKKHRISLKVIGRVLKASAI